MRKPALYLTLGCPRFVAKEKKEHDDSSLNTKCEHRFWKVSRGGEVAESPPPTQIFETWFADFMFKRILVQFASLKWPEELTLKIQWRQKETNSRKGLTRRRNKRKKHPSPRALLSAHLCFWLLLHSFLTTFSDTPLHVLSTSHSNLLCFWLLLRQVHLLKDHVETHRKSDHAVQEKIHGILS